jgi:hypothetical protein
MTQPCASAHAKSAASGTIAPQLPAAPNRLQTELTLATSLLTTGGARYVCVIDRGPDREPGGTPYDLHYDDDNQPAARILSNNVFNLCTALADQIDATQTNPSKIHLDDTLIIIHSEFGRTTYRNKDHLGRDHWPGGYAAVLIGGPIKSRAIAGGIAVPVPAPNPGNIYPPPPPTSDALAFGAQGAGSAPFSPTDIRGALMVAAGIDPMAQENFGVGDFSSLIQSQGSESAVRTSLQTQILGV